MGPIAWRRLRAAIVFLDAARRYWLTVYPLARWHARRWRACARAIPDAALRRIALETHRAEGGNLEGAAAFAALAPLRRRASVVRASVAFQAAYDYVDALAEQPHPDPGANGRALHEALQVALRPDARHAAYFRHRPPADDGGYLCVLVDACQEALLRLPAHRVVAPRLADAAARMVAYQVRVHRPPGETGALAAWARAGVPRASALAWWEAAAAAASSLGAFALIAAAADPRLSAAEAEAIDRAYFPWAGALHVLLDSLVDQPADAATGHCSLVDCYADPDETAARLGAIATTAFASAHALRDGGLHTTILAAMSAYYLCAPAASLPHAAPAREQVLAAAGSLGRPALAVMRGRRRPARPTLTAPAAGTSAPAARCASR